MGMDSRLRSTVVAAVVGLAALLAPAATAAPPSAPTGTFTALTYNVAGLPEQLSGSEPATNSPLISPLLNAYDLVLLQENWADPLAEQRQDGLVPESVPRLGYHDQVVADADHAYRSESAQNPPPPSVERFPTGPALSADGLNQLSRFFFGPLQRVAWDECHGELAVTVAEEVLKQSGLDDALDDGGLGAVNDSVDGGATDCAAHKGFSVSTAEIVPGLEVDIYNLHAEAGNSDADRAASEAGFVQLAEFIEDHSAGRAIILGGDTNLHTDRADRQWEADAWRRFRDATGLVDVCDELDCGADRGRIDKFAFRSSRRVRIVPLTHHFEVERFVRDDGQPLSDHDALAVRFRWVRLGPA